MEFIGPSVEFSELNAHFTLERFEMGVVYGSRRIGKTSLLKEFVKDKAFFYFQAKEFGDLDNLDDKKMQCRIWRNENANDERKTIFKERDRRCVAVQGSIPQQPYIVLL